MPYDNTNSGVLFIKKSANPKAPAYSGNLNVGGVEYEIAGWNKTSKKGNEFISLSVKRKEYSEDANDGPDF